MRQLMVSASWLLLLGVTAAGCGSSSSPAAPSSTSPTPSASATAPAISAISPAPLLAEASKQSIIITGSNFAAGLSLIVTTPAGVAQTVVVLNGFPGPLVQEVQFKSSTSLLAILILDTSGTYTIQAANANGEKSNVMSAPVQGILSGVVSEGVRLTDVTAGFPGQPFADVASFPTRSGGWRLLFDAGGAIRSASSPDGLSLTMEPGIRIPLQLNDGTSVRPALVKVIRLDSGRLRVFFSYRSMYSAISDDDGLTFAMEDGVRVDAGAAGGNTITAGSVVRSGGGWRMYFSDADRVYSASSSDLFNWTVDAGVRVGPGSTLSGSPAGHPCAILNTDGSVSLFVFHGPSASNPAPPLSGLYVATSTDGLTFSHEIWTGIVGFDPDVVQLGTGLRLYYNVGDDHGGTIYSARLPALSASSGQQSLPMAGFAPIMPAPGPGLGRPGPVIVPVAPGRSGRGGIVIK